MGEDHKEQGEQSIHDYLRLIRLRWMLILTVFLCVMANATLYVALQQRYYTSTARIKVEGPRSTIAVFDINRVSEPSFVHGEVEMIRSPRVLHAVIERLNLRTRYAAPDGIAAAVFHPFATFKHRYFYPINEFLRLRKPSNREQISLESAYHRLQSGVEVERWGAANVVEIQVRDTQSARAAEIANTIAQVYKEESLAYRRERIAEATNTLGEQLKVQEDRMLAAQKEVERLRKELNIPAFFSTRPSDQTIQRLESDIAEVRAQIVSLETRIRELQKLTPEQRREVIATIIQDPNLKRLYDELTTAELRLAVLREGYGPDHPEVREATAQKAELDRQLGSRLEGVLRSYQVELAMAQSREKELLRHGDEVRQMMARIDDVAYIPFRNAQRAEESERMLYESIEKRIQAETVEMHAGRSPVELLDSATASSMPTKPKVARILMMAVVLGLGLGFSLVMFLDYSNTSIKKIDDVETYLGRPVLGVIPNQARLLTDGEDALEHAEVYRMLRTHLDFTRESAGTNSFCLQSAGAGEGKSLTLANLAYVCAQQGLRVLVVDCDLYRPTMHALFGGRREVGLADYLKGEKSLAETIQPTQIRGVHMISAGTNGYDHRHTPALTAQRMRKLSREVGQQYDIVFYDTPPVLAISDSAIVARAVGTSIFVLQHRRYPRKMERRALQVLEKAGVNLLGVVVNKVDLDNADFGEYQPYDYKYYHSAMQSAGNA